MSEDSQSIPVVVLDEVKSALALGVMELGRMGKHADADIIMHAIDALRNAQSDA